MLTLQPTSYQQLVIPLRIVAIMQVRFYIPNDWFRHGLHSIGIHHVLGMKHLARFFITQNVFPTCTKEA